LTCAGVASRTLAIGGNADPSPANNSHLSRT
jgi:hypothetical protein